MQFWELSQRWKSCAIGCSGKARQLVSHVKGPGFRDSTAQRSIRDHPRRVIQNGLKNRRVFSTRTVFLCQRIQPVACRTSVGIVGPGHDALKGYLAVKSRPS
jgi:hypothetical protein